jgi:hypothetical protein
MAYEAPAPFRYSGIAGGTVAAYRFLQDDGSGRVIHATGEGQNIAGVSQMAGTLDTAIEVWGPPCVVKITASGALAAGTKVVPTVDGKAAAAGAAGTEYWGWLLEASTGDNQLVTLMFIPGTV